MRRTIGNRAILYHETNWHGSAMLHLISIAALILLVGCDTSPKPTVTPQPEVTQQSDGDKAQAKKNENKPATAAQSSDKDKPGNRRATDGTPGKETATNETRDK